MRWLVAVGWVAFALAACGGPDLPAGDSVAPEGTRGGGASTSQPSPGQGTAPEGERVTPETTTPLDPRLAGWVESARADLADRLDVLADEIVVLVAEAVVWPDSSLGCPEPGKAYLQVLTDGYRIILEAEGSRYAYHGASGEAPFYCQRPS